MHLSFSHAFRWSTTNHNSLKFFTTRTGLTELSCLEGISLSQSRMPQLEKLTPALTAAGLNPNPIFILMGFIFLLIIIILSLFLILYVYAMFRHYSSFMETVLRKNREGGVLHEFSYSWLKGVTLKPIIPTSLKKEDGGLQA